VLRADDDAPGLDMADDETDRQLLEIVDGLFTAIAAEADPRVEWLYRQIAQPKDVEESRAVSSMPTDSNCPNSRFTRPVFSTAPAN